MDQTKQSALTSLLTMLATKGLTAFAAALATHGIISSSGTETVVAAGLALLTVGISFWREYGKAIVTAQLEMLKAKSLAQADKLRQNSIPAPTVTEIAARSPTMEPADVAAAAKTLPPEIQSNIVGLPPI